jgi:hypothetical protein
VDLVHYDMRDAAEAGLKLTQQHAHRAKEDRAEGSGQHRLKPVESRGSSVSAET